MLNPDAVSVDLAKWRTFVFSLSTILFLEWFIATQNVFALRIFFPIVTIIMMSYRVYEFCFVKHCPLFFLEMCYFVWVWSVVVIAMGADVKYIYPFIHGPLIIFTIIDGEAYAFDNMNKITSVMLHNFSSIVTCIMYINSDDFEQLDKLGENFLYYFVYSIVIFGFWYIPFSIFLFAYNGTGKTLLRHKLVKDQSKPTPLDIKIKYFFCYLIALIAGLSFGVVSMHCIQLSYAMMGVSLVSIICNTGWYYCTNGDRKNKFSIIKLIKLALAIKEKEKKMLPISPISNVVDIIVV